jgi:hypothetical protein
LYLNFERGYQFTCGSEATSTAYDTVKRVWQHLNFFQHSCFLHARVPRVKNSEGEIHQVSVLWARPGSGFTLLFEAYAMLLIESEMSVKKVSSCMNVTVPHLWRVLPVKNGKYGKYAVMNGVNASEKRLLNLGFELQEISSDEYETIMSDYNLLLSEVRRAEHEKKMKERYDQVSICLKARPIKIIIE